jgi:hypothetical protein
MNSNYSAKPNSWLPHAIPALPSWPAALGLLLLVGVPGCVISETRSCKRCHLDCGSFRPECHAACDESDECRALRAGGEVRS